MRLSSTITSVLLGLLYLPQSTLAHSWIEQINVIAPNGTMIGAPGYPRGNSPRGAGFVEAQMVHLVNNGPNVQPTDSMCSQTQKQYEANPRSPRLQASPGQAVALRYQENGHVSLPDTQKGKPQNRGTVFVYATTQPSPADTLMGIHRQWTADGNGGDRRGRLLATANYDDGQCYQINGGPISQQRQQQFKHSSVDPQGQNLWCQTDVLLPSDLAAGNALTLYWVWDWPTMPGVDPGLPQGKQEIYTTCMDVDIVPRAGNAQGVLNAQAYSWVPQDIGNAAVPAQMHSLGAANAVSNPAMIPFQGQPQSVGGGSNSGSSKPSPPASAPASPSNKPSASSPAPPPASPSAANKPTPGSPPANAAPAAPQAPPAAPQGIPNNGQSGNNGNNGGPNQSVPNNSGTPGSDNGSRPPAAAAPGVFADTPEFGTGSGTAINPVGNNGGNSQGQQQPPPAAAPQPPAPTQPPAIPAQNLGPVGRPGRVVTVETFVTETVVRTVTAGGPQQNGQNVNQSESAKSSTSVVTSSVASADVTSVSTTTSVSAAASQESVSADDVVYETADVVTPADTDLMSEVSAAPSAKAEPTTSSSSPPPTTSTAETSTASGVKVVPISTASTSTSPQVKPIKRQPQPNVATIPSNSHLLGVTFKPTATAPAPLPPPPSTLATVTVTVTAKPSMKPASKKPITNITPYIVQPAATAIPVPFSGPRENVARSNVETPSRPPCYRRHGMFKLRSRAPLYILPEGVEEEVGDC